MRDEEQSFLAEAKHRDLTAKWWAKIRKAAMKQTGLEHSPCQIRGIATRAPGEKAVWHFPSRKRYFNIDRSKPNSWGMDS